MAASSGPARSGEGPPVGDYALTPDLIVSIREAQGRLTFSLGSHKSLPMEPAGSNTYCVKALDTTVSFRTANAARASSVTLARYGERVVALRRDAATASAEPSPSGSIVAAVETLTPKLMVALNVPGVAVAGISRCRVAWHREFGVRTAGKPARVARDTVFEACSMSKTPFAYVVLKLVEQGALDLDRPLADYLDKPYIPDQPRHTKITARMALSHTTGFPNWRKGGCQGGGPLPVLFEPGTKFGYSGEGFLYLQRVVERVTGQPLEPLMRKRLLDPLGMAVSSYVWHKRFEGLAARGHNSSGEPTPSRPRFRDANAAFSLYTTATEYAKFLAEIMRKDRAAPHSLSKPSLDAMLAPAVRATGRKPIQRRGKPTGARIHWGLGWPMTRTASGYRYHHGGANGERFRCFCEFDPIRGTGLVIMTNAASGDALWRKLIAAVSDP